MELLPSTISILHPSATTLLEALCSLLPGDVSGNTLLLHEGEHPVEYEMLLTQTAIGTSKAPPQITSLQQVGRQQEVVMRAIDALVRTRQDNVLRHGYRKRGPSTSSSSLVHITGMYHSACWCRNTSGEILLAPPWQHLLSRVGDAVMMHLLLSTSLYVRLKNDSFLQLTGAPVTQVAREARRSSMNILTDETRRKDESVTRRSGGRGRGGGTTVQGKSGVVLNDGSLTLCAEGDGGANKGPGGPSQHVYGVDEELQKTSPPILTDLSSVRGGPQRPQARDQGREEVGMPNRGDNGTLMYDKKGARGCCGPGGICPPGGEINDKRSKAGRPSSWKRKKAAKLRSSGVEPGSVTGPVSDGCPVVRPPEDAGGALVDLDGFMTQEITNGAGLAAHSWGLTVEQVDPGAKGLQVDGSKDMPTLSGNLCPDHDVDMAAEGREAEAGQNDTPGLGLSVEVPESWGPVDWTSLVDVDQPLSQELPTTPAALWGCEDEEEAEQEMGAGRMTCGETRVRKAPGEDDSGPQEVPTSPQQAKQTAPLGQAGDNGGPRGLQAQHPRSSFADGWHRLSQLVLPRSRILYCSTYGSRPGLRASGALMRVRGTPGAARRLYAHIFLSSAPGDKSTRTGEGARETTRGGPGPQGGQVPGKHTSLVAAPRHIRRGHRQLLALLHQVMARSSRCPYLMLLNKHCPLNTNLLASAGPHSVTSPPPPPPPLHIESPQAGVAEGLDGFSRQRNNKRTRLTHGGVTSGSCVTGKTQGVDMEGKETAPGPMAGLPPGPSPPISECVVPPGKVVQYLWSVIRHLLPPALLGSTKNWRSFRDVLQQFIHLRRHEQMTLHTVVQGIRTSEVPWMTGAQYERQRGKGIHGGQGDRVPRSLHQSRQRWLSQLLWWVMTEVVIPLVRSSFYVTDSEPYRHVLLYLRKPVWRQLELRALRDLTSQRFEQMRTEEALRVLKDRQLGVARIRMVPKAAGMRAIVNLGRPSHVTFKRATGYLPRAQVPSSGRHGGPKLTSGGKRTVSRGSVHLSFKPVNFWLQDVYQVLRAETLADPASLDATVFGYDDILKVLHPFLRRCRAARAHQGNELKVYILSVDVSRAFDCIQVPKLLQLVQPLVKNEEYLIVRYAEVSSTQGKLRTRHQATALAPPSSYQGFPHLAQRLSEQSSNAVFMEQLPPRKTSKGEALSRLTQHLNDHMVKVGQHWYRQRCGIAQGSVLSTLLCSLYLADLERRHLQPVLPSVGMPAAITPGSSGQGNLSALATCWNNVALRDSQNVDMPKQGGKDKGSCVDRGSWDRSQEVQDRMSPKVEASAVALARPPKSRTLPRTMCQGTVPHGPLHSQLFQPRSSQPMEGASVDLSELMGQALQFSSQVSGREEPRLVTPSHTVNPPGSSSAADPMDLDRLPTSSMPLITVGPSAGTLPVPPHEGAHQAAPPPGTVSSTLQKHVADTGRGSFSEGLEMGPHKGFLLSASPFTSTPPLGQVPTHTSSPDPGHDLQSSGVPGVRADGSLALLGTSHDATNGRQGIPPGGTGLAGTNISSPRQGRGPTRSGPSPGGRSEGLLQVAGPPDCDHHQPEAPTGVGHHDDPLAQGHGGGTSTGGQGIGALVPGSPGGPFMSVEPIRGQGLLEGVFYSPRQAASSDDIKLPTPGGTESEAALTTSSKAANSSSRGSERGPDGGRLSLTLSLTPSSSIPALHLDMTPDSTDAPLPCSAEQSEGVHDLTGKRGTAWALTSPWPPGAHQGAAPPLDSQGAAPPLDSQDAACPSERMRQTSTPEKPSSSSSNKGRGRPPAGQGPGMSTPSVNNDPSPSQLGDIALGTPPESSLPLILQIPDSTSPQPGMNGIVESARGSRHVHQCHETSSGRLTSSQSLKGPSRIGTGSLDMGARERRYPSEDDPERLPKNEMCGGDQRGHSGDSHGPPGVAELQGGQLAPSPGLPGGSLPVHRSAPGGHRSVHSIIRNPPLQIAPEPPQTLSPFEKGESLPGTMRKPLLSLELHLSPLEGEGSGGHRPVGACPALLGEPNQLEAPGAQRHLYETPTMAPHYAHGSCISAAVNKIDSPETTVVVQGLDEGSPEVHSISTTVEVVSKDPGPRMDMEVESQGQIQGEDMDIGPSHLLPMRSPGPVHHPGAPVELAGSDRSPCSKRHKAAHSPPVTATATATVDTVPAGGGGGGGGAAAAAGGGAVAAAAAAAALDCDKGIGDKAKVSGAPTAGGAPTTGQGPQASNETGSAYHTPPMAPATRTRWAESVMLRLVDDFLFISTSRAAAEVITRRMHQGFPEYGCAINPTKTRLNFSVTLDDGDSLQEQLWKDGRGQSWVKWCGLLIHTASLELMADYTRYAGQHISATLTVPLGQKPGEKLLDKVVQYLRPKCHALLLDTSINSLRTVHLNIYQSFLLCAMKFHWYVRTLRVRGPQKDGRIYFRTVKVAIMWMCKKVPDKVRVANRRLHLQCQCDVSKCEIEWLGLKGFQWVLSRKQSLYQPVLSWLEDELSHSRFKEISSHLLEVVDPSGSSVFNDIRF